MTIIYSPRRIDEERARWDTDDRVRCECIADHSLDGGRSRCLNSTRHPSRKCTDCRIATKEVQRA